MKPGTILFFLAYGVILGAVAQRAGIPEKAVARTREFIDSETRRTARIMTDEIHARHKELEAARI